MPGWNPIQSITVLIVDSDIHTLLVSLKLAKNLLSTGKYSRLSIIIITIIVIVILIVAIVSLTAHPNGIELNH